MAESYGLVVAADDIKTGFRKAFKEVAGDHPLYGKHSSPPLHYEQWWELVIEKTFEYAHVPGSDLQIALPTLMPALMDRFASDKGYILHDDTLSALTDLEKRGLKLGIISNSDPRTIGVVESLGVVPDLIPKDKMTLSWDVGKPKPDSTIFKAACKNLGLPAEQTLMIGDDLDEDYTSAKTAGLQAVLLQRSRNDADWVRRELGRDELEHVEVITSLADLPAWLDKRQSNS